MPSDFRFMVICRAATDDENPTLTEVVNELSFSSGDFPFDLELIVAIGAVFLPEYVGKSLALAPFVEDQPQVTAPSRIAGAPRHRLTLPEASGAAVCTFSISLPLAYPGVYGFYLFDDSGVFEPERTLLATYTFVINEDG